MSETRPAVASVVWWRSRSSRRAVTVLAALVWLGLVGLAAFTDSAEGSWQWVLSLVVVVLLWAVARIATGDLAHRRPELLDERENEIRWRLSRTGYLCALTAGFAGGVYLIAVQSDPELLQRGASLMLSLVVGAACVPSFLWAWSAEDPDDD
jgi:amino acid transporter